MVEAVFFDVGGVLGYSTIMSVHEELVKRDKEVNKERFRALLMNRRVLTGPIGTLERLLRTEFCDLGLSATDILTIVRQEPIRHCKEHRKDYCIDISHIEFLLLYKDIWGIARELREKTIPVGVISDQFAESASFLRQNYALRSVFDPILFSPEVGLTKETTEIFDEAKRRVNKNANKLLMIDDHRFVLDVAESAGWKTLLCHDYKTLREDLRSAYRLPIMSEEELQKQYTLENERFGLRNRHKI